MFIQPSSLIERLIFVPKAGDSIRRTNSLTKNIQALPSDFFLSSRLVLKLDALASVDINLCFCFLKVQVLFLIAMQLNQITEIKINVW